jgi:hypothetical protein
MATKSGMARGHKKKRLSGEEIIPNKIYSTTQIAQILGVTSLTVTKLAGELKGKRVGKEYLFIGASVISYFGSYPSDSFFAPRPKSDSDPIMKEADLFEK